MKNGGTDKADVLQGTLILLVLRTLGTLGPLHGYGIARRLEQIGGHVGRESEEGGGAAFYLTVPGAHSSPKFL